MKSKLFGVLLLIEAAALLLTAGVALHYQHTAGEGDAPYFLLTAGLTGAVGLLFYNIGNMFKKSTLQIRDTFFVVALSWVLFSLFGMLPFLMYGTMDNVTDAFFETMWSEAERVYALSNGAFDITVAPLVKAFGFGRKSEQMSDISSQTIDSIRQFVGFDKVRLENHKVIKTDPRVMIDGGAVAKGQACDMIAEMLRRQGCNNYLVDIGGEVVAHGVNAKGEPWHIGITKPNLNNEGAQEELQQIIAVTDVCMATSGNYRNYYYDGDVRRSHTIDPRTGYPVQHSVLSATIVASTCMRADALATACMVLGADDALDMISRTTDAACYLLVAQKDSLVVVSSENWDKSIQ